MVKFNFFLRTVILLLVMVITGSWGFLVHRTTGQLAIYALPERMQGFFFKERAALMLAMVQPDLRRNLDPAEGPRHFIDLEMYSDSTGAPMPQEWPEAIRRFGREKLQRYGYLPYAIMMSKQMLTEAFRQGNADSIIRWAGDLGHYIGDAHVPLHSTTNYDGQLSGQKGIHNLWESTVPEVELNQYDLYGGRKAAYIPNAQEAAWNTIISAHQLLGDVLAMERQAARAFPDSTKYQVHMQNGRQVISYTRAFAVQYGRLLGPSVNHQLLESARQIADFWYSAWVDAGSPDLSKLAGQPLSGSERSQWRQEYKAYRQNDLIRKGWLLARQSGTTGE